MEPVLDTLQQAIEYFSNPVTCREYVVARRWPNGVECPRCGSKNVAFLDKYDRWQCSARHDGRQFAKTGTVFEDSPLPLSKWLMAMWEVVNCKNGVSSYGVHRAIGITQKSAWFMDHRIRHALTLGTINKLSGQIEAGETLIGGKARNMRRAKRERVITGTGGKDEAAVMGILERGSKVTGSKVRAKVVENTKKKALQSEIREHVLAGSAIFTDALQSNDGLDEFQHEVAGHAVEYVRGEVHTNGLENFWSLLKRSIWGTYVSVEPFHLFRYLDEQAWRYNQRKMNDGERFDLAVRAAIGKRLSWNQLTGKVAKNPPSVN
jgi:transposase-like protein